jgi:hypothetical protein
LLKGVLQKLTLKKEHGNNSKRKIIYENKSSNRA